MSVVNQQRFPINESNPLAFVEHTILRLSEVNTAQDLNDVLTEFLNSEVIEFVERHRNMFFITAEMWNDTIRRSIFNTSDLAFPDGLLVLPPLFNRLGWIVDGSSWRGTARRQEQRFMKDPCLANLLALLFAEAMQGNFANAVSQYQQRLPLIPENEIEQVERYEEQLSNFGWPMLIAA